MGALGQTSVHAVKCSNCRYEYDLRSVQNALQQSSQGPCCPNCGYLYGHQQLMAQQQQMNQYQQAQNWNNQGLLGGGLSSGLAGMQNSLSSQAIAEHVKKQMMTNGIVPEGYVPELVEYENRVRSIKVELPEIAKETKMFGLIVKRKELQLEIRKLTEDLEHHKKNEEMRIAEAVQKQRLQHNEEVAKVKLESAKTVADANNKNELTVTQLQGKFTRDKAELQAQFAKDLAEARAKAAEDYYDKMTKALTELHQNGDKNSKFIQELALTMVKKAPKTLPAHARISAKGSIKDLKQLESDE